jgi:PAS domain S-box-containing protein
MNNLLTPLRHFFSAPVFVGDEEKTSNAKLLHQIVLAVWVMLVLASVVVMFDAEIRVFALPAIMLVTIILVVIMALNRAGRLRLASQVIVGIVLAAFTYLNFVTAGEPRPILLLTTLAILMGGLLLGSRGALTTAIILVLQNTIIIALHMQGLITPQAEAAPPIANMVVNGVSYLLIGFMFRLAIQRIQLVINQVQVSNRELQNLSTALEQRVAERTKALTSVAEISTATSTILDIDKLLQQVVDLAKERFGLYHAHIYLLNETDNTLVLTSGAGEIGRQMVAEKRSIPFDREQSLVARAARERKGVTVNDVTQAPDFLPHPLLPNTRAELAVPMMVGDQVLGVFDVQSEVVGRFTEADIAVQTTLASQVASAVQNARSYTEIQHNQVLLSEALSISRLGNWEYDVYKDLFTFNDHFYSIFRTSVDKVGGYKISSADYARNFVHPEDAALVGSEIQRVMESKERHFSTALEHRIIFADGEVGYIAVRLNVERDEDGKIIRWTGANQDITERKRLEQLTAQRARQQETLNLITQKIQGTATIEAALQIAARELGHALGTKSTLVMLESAALTGEHKGSHASEELPNA